jgi:hypothetical protein
MDEPDQGAAETEHAHRRGLRAPRGRVARQLARRHRRERIIGILIAVLGIAVLIVAVIALRHPRQAATAAGSDTRKSTPSAPNSVIPSTSTSTSPSVSGSNGTVTGSQPLIVLNQTTTPDLAAQAAQRFRSGGWRVTSTEENYQNDVITTTAYYDPNVSGARQAANALQKQFSTIHRVAARFPQLPPGPVVVVLTTDYSST